MPFRAAERIDSNATTFPKLPFTRLRVSLETTDHKGVRVRLLFAGRRIEGGGEGETHPPRFCSSITTAPILSLSSLGARDDSSSF
jgi:hypothetical protein